MTSPVVLPQVRSIGPVLILSLILLATPAEAQGNGTGAPAHPAVCADGVRRYVSLSAVPAPFDSLRMPPGPPIRITSPEEEQAAEREMRRRAGQAGATGLVMLDETSEEGRAHMVRRRVVPVFVAADSARAQAACRGAAPDSAATPGAASAGDSSASNSHAAQYRD